jgi:predicted outer membrane repeat protein
MLRRIVSCFAALALAGAGPVLLPASPAAGGASLAVVVDTTVDDFTLDACTAAPNDCSLRGALEGYANDNHVDGQTIDVTVPAGEYELEAQIYLYQANVNVHGAGVGSTIVSIDRSGDDPLIRHLELNTDGELIVTLSDMTFTGGNGDQNPSAGGSILARYGAHLTLNRMHVVDNEVRGDGGAIAFYGDPANQTLVIEDSTFAGNSASELGGAIHIDQGETAEITNSTFTDNVAAVGGAIFVGHEGGVPTSATLTHVTLADNGLDIGQEGPADGGGAIGVGGNGTVTLEGTVIERSVEAEGFAPTALGDPVANCWVFGEGEIVSQGHNVVDDDTCSLDQDTDQPETAAGTAALSDNGGPTFTMAIASGSPATDTAGDTCDVADDQRGVERPQDGNADDTVACDAGAYEREAEPETPEEPPAALPAEATPDFTG